MPRSAATFPLDERDGGVELRLFAPSLDKLLAAGARGLASP